MNTPEAEDAMSIEIDRLIIQGEGISEEQAWDLARHVGTELAGRLADWSGPLASIETIQPPGVAWDSDSVLLARGIANGIVSAMKR